MATLTVNSIPVNGLRTDNALVAAAGGGDAFAPGTDVYFRCANGAGAPITITFVTPGSTAGLATADETRSVINAQTWEFGPFPAEVYADPTTGLVTVTYSSATTVTVGAFRISRR